MTSLIVKVILLSLPALAVVFPQTRHDCFIKVGGTDSLDATYYVPTDSMTHGGFPGLIFVHGFAEDKTSDTASCDVYSTLGLITLCYSVRGHGLSTGSSTIMSAQERRDLKRVVAFVRSLPEIDSSDIGITGGSQGGLHGLWAAVDNLGMSAITTDVIIPHWASDLFANGSIRLTFLDLLTANSVRYAPVRDTLLQMVREDRYDSLKACFPRGRDVDTDFLDSSRVPLLWFLKWQDHYFSASDGIAAYHSSEGPRKMYLGTGGHNSDGTQIEWQYQFDQLTRWFRQFLLHQETGILSEPFVTYAYSSLPVDAAGVFTWRHETVPDWPPAGVSTIRFYLAGDSALAATPPPVRRDSVAVENDYQDTAYTFDSALNDWFSGPDFSEALPAVKRRFDSPPLASDVYWLGEPTVHLSVRPDAPEFPLHIQIFEVDSLGREYFINRINYTGRHWTPGAEGTVEVTGIPHAHRFSRGSRIRIALTNIDTASRTPADYDPFVVPLFAKADVEVFTGSDAPSWIELPMLGSPLSVPLASASPGAGLHVFPNYPNPFNSSTRISFTLSRPAETTVRIFNVLGQEVEVLLHRGLSPGNHTVLWDARDRPSGVYFCRVEAASPTDRGKPATMVQKMLVLK